MDCQDATSQIWDLFQGQEKDTVSRYEVTENMKMRGKRQLRQQKCGWMSVCLRPGSIVFGVLCISMLTKINKKGSDACTDNRMNTH